MNCRTVQPQLLDFSGGRLESALSRAVAAHLKGCAECRGVLERELRTAALLGAMPRASLADHAWNSVALRLHHAAPVPRRSSGVLPRLAWAGGLTVVAALVFAHVSPMSRPSLPPPEPESLRGLSPAAAAGLGPERTGDPLVAAQRRMDLLLDGIAERGS